MDSNAAGKKSTSKQKQKTEEQTEKKSEDKPAKQPEPVKKATFSEAPFELTGYTIPNNFLGHDLRKIYYSLESRLKREKSEFETTAEFNARVEREDKLSLYGSLNMTDNFALVVDADSVYDADNKSLKILVPLEHSWRTKFAIGIKGQEIENSKREYVGSNAYGATANITAYSTANAVLVVNNSSSYKIDKSSNSYGERLQVLLNDISVETARNITGNLSAVCVFKLDNPFIGEDGYYSGATINQPTVMVVSNKLIYGSVSAIIVFNNKSGEILHRAANIDEVGKKEKKGDRFYLEGMAIEH